MLEGVGHEPQAGGVAEAEVAAPFAVEAGCGVAAAGPGAVLDLVVAQLAEQPGTQELCPVGNPEGVSLGVPEVGAHTELAVPVEGGAAQDVSGIGHLFGLGLEAVGEAVDEVVVEADAAVTAGQHQDPRVEPCGLLERHRLPEFCQVGIVDGAIDECGAHLPG